jgi:hypothetical protein
MSPVGTRDARSESLDHCHSTGRVRGLLCKRCNSGIGYLGDTRLGVQAAIAYLSRPFPLLDGPLGEDEPDE